MCSNSTESIDHLMFTCPRVASRWLSLKMTTRNSRFDFSGSNSLFEMIDLAISRQRRRPSFIIMVEKTISFVWLERNVVVFRQDRNIVPPFVVWRKTLAQLEALELRTTNARIRNIIKEDYLAVLGFMSPT